MAKEKASKPIVSIKNFSAMADAGLYWLDGFIPKTMQGQTVLTRGWNSKSLISETTSGFSNLGSSVTDNILTSMTYFLNNTSLDLLGITSGGYIFDFVTSGPSIGQIHQVGTTGSVLMPSQKGYLNVSKHGHILYSSGGNVGVGWVGIVTSGSTTTLVDTGRNFTTSGMGTTAGINKVYNLTKKVEHTITSISTTTNANDTLNFSVGTAPSANDIYIAFSDTRFSLGVANSSFNNLQFTPQPAAFQWNRQIEYWNDTFYILNGNYLATLSSDDTTWTTDLIGNSTLPSDKYFKQLPNNYQGLMISTNQDRMMVSAENRGKGALLLWDGYADAWISKLEVDAPPSGLIKYGYYWLVAIGTSVYQTDGYTLTLVDSIPDSEYTDNYNQMKCNMIPTDDGFMLSFFNNQSDDRRCVDGTWIYSFVTKGWCYSPITDKNGVVQQSYCSLFSVNQAGYPTIFTSYKRYNGATPGYEIGTMNKNRYGKKSSAMFFIKLPEKMGVELIELNIQPKADYNAAQNYGKTNVISVNYGQGYQPMYNQLQVASGSTTTALNIYNVNMYINEIGQEILVQDGNGGYSRSFITTITNPNTSVETLGLSPALAAAPAVGDYVRKLDLYSCQSLIINADAIEQELQFAVDSFQSDKLWVEVVFENQKDLPLDLCAITIW